MSDLYPVLQLEDN